MKTFCLIAWTLITVAAVYALPTRTPRFMWMPDGEGRIHLVDLEETEIVPALNPAKDISLLVYTRNNPTSPQNIRIEQHEVASNFNPSAQTRFVIHGWISSPRTMDHIRAAYMADSSTAYNVILVDWSGPAGGLYTSAKANSKEVGVYVAQVISYLQQNKGLSPDNVQLVGHSLGAHASGVAGNRLGGVLARITGMDPAAPLFGSTALQDRLDHSDARHVQVIHTCGGLLGWDDPMGDADFYPNGGKSIQPGCGLDLAGSCSHSRAHEFFAESITSKVGFRGVICSSWSNYKSGNCNNNAAALLGEKSASSAKGSFFLKTGSSSPYAQG